jgi:hypothetical protein
MAKRIPFWAKTHSILGQNVSHFGPKRLSFPYKTSPVLIQNATTACHKLPFEGSRCYKTAIFFLSEYFSAKAA